MKAVMEFAAPWLGPGLLLMGEKPLAGLEKILYSLLGCNGMFALGLLILTMLLFYLRKNCCKRPDRTAITWDCGYAEPTARMQYTATAFTQPLADLFNVILHQKKSIIRPEKLFPERSAIEVETPDGGSRWLWMPLFRVANHISDRVRHLQSGVLHIYILLMVLALLTMLVCSLLTVVPEVAEAENIDNISESVTYE